MGDEQGIIQRGGSGVLQSKKAGGRFGKKAATPADGPITVLEETVPPREIDRTKLPTQANRQARGPEVIG